VLSDKPFDAEAFNIGGQASATNGLSDATNRFSDMKNAPCNRPVNNDSSERKIQFNNVLVPSIQQEPEWVRLQNCDKKYSGTAFF
jgi:hypothetical protein